MEWPALTVLYGLMPWHVERLTWDELDQYRKQAPDFAKLRMRG